MQKLLEVIFPCTNQGIEIVLPIPLRGSLLSASFRCVRILPRESLERLHHDNQTAHHETSPNVFDAHRCLLLTRLLGRCPDLNEDRPDGKHSRTGERMCESRVKSS